MEYASPQLIAQLSRRFLSRSSSIDPSQISNGSIDEVKLSFDPATQAELDAQVALLSAEIALVDGEASGASGSAAANAAAITAHEHPIVVYGTERIRQAKDRSPALRQALEGTSD